jgi:hypothetical protein
MSGSAIVAAGIGLVSLYLLLSLVSSAMIEWLSRIQGLRAGVLRSEVSLLLGAELAAAFNSSPLITGMFENGSYPLYIPPSTFALALIDIGFEYAPGTHGEPGTVSLKKKWCCAQNPERAARVLLESLKQDSTNFGSLQLRIEKWFELAMEQAAGRYKRRTQLYILTISLLIVAVGNVDTIAIWGGLYEGAVGNAPVRFPIGWWAPETPPLDFARCAGLFLSWAALSLGGPFWFDVLNKLVNLRHTGLPPDENPRGKAGSGLTAQ